MRKIIHENLSAIFFFLLSVLFYQSIGQTRFPEELTKALVSNGRSQSSLAFNKSRNILGGLNGLSEKDPFDETSNVPHYLPFTGGATCYAGTVNREAAGYHTNFYIGPSGSGNILYAWGEDAASMTSLTSNANASGNNLCIPTAVPTSAYVSSSEIPIEIRGASEAGSNTNFFLLRTNTNLYLFGDANNYSKVAPTGWGSTTISGSSILSHLPASVSISSIASVQLSPTSMAIVTTAGNVWMTSSSGTLSSTVFGDNNATSAAATYSNGWHKVLVNSTTALTGVTNLTLADGAAIAVTSTGSVYFWGYDMPVNGTMNSSAITANHATTYAALVTLPTLNSGASIIQAVCLGTGTATSGTSIFLLSSDGYVYAAGDNSNSQLGNGNTTNSTSLSKITVLSNIIKIDGSTESCTSINAMGALSSNGSLYCWGDNNGGIIGGGSSSVTSLTTPTIVNSTSLSPSSDFNIGGHFTISFDVVNNCFWYLGHYKNASMGDANTACGNTANEYTLFKVANTIPISFSCSVAAPTISTTGTLSGFSECYGNASVEQNFIVSGSNLSTSLTVTAPTGFEITTTSGTGYASTITLAPSAGIVNSTTIYVRLKSMASGGASTNITITSTGATTQNIATGTATVNALPTITLASVTNINSSSTVFSLPYTATTGNQYSITTGTPTAMPNFTAVTNASLVSSPISVVVPASATNTYNFNIAVKNSTTGCTSIATPFTVQVVTPTITPTAALNTFTTCAGSASASQNFTVSGSTCQQILVLQHLLDLRSQLRRVVALLHPSYCPKLEVLFQAHQFM